MEVNKMKTSKKIISFVLCAVMVLSTFCGLGFVLDDFKAKAADITLSDNDISITQKRIVTDYEAIYEEYQTRFFSGAHSNEPTNFVIPGLSASDYYTPQGMTYWAEKEWILISAYDASGSGKNSVIYALDVTTTEFVALFKIYNDAAFTKPNTSHGGGIAASEYNFYYADSSSLISYIPLSEMDVEPGTVKNVYLWDSIDCSGELYGANTSYCCYDDGILWAGNFYYSGSNSYNAPAHSNYDSMLVGYKLMGNSSEEEWFYLQDKNLIDATTLGTNLTGVNSAITYTSAIDENGYFDISGSVAASSAGEDYFTIGTATLFDGFTYKLEFDISAEAETIDFDFYFLRDGGTSCLAQTSYTGEGFYFEPNENGGYRCEFTFTVGEAIANTQTNWGSTSDASGTYNIRFDQNNVATAHNFTLSNVRISEVVAGFETTEATSQNCAGNPTHVIAFSGFDKVQYAMVDKGKIYISRSWKRTYSSNHTRELMIGDIDINSPGTMTLTVNNRSRSCHLVTYSDATHFGGDYGDELACKKMLFMGEALCVIEDNLYMFGESAAYTYYGDGSTGGDSGDSCPEPIDVIWKIDHHALMEEYQNQDDSTASYYQKVNSLDEISGDDQYIIVYESDEVDPVTQRNVLYAFDSYGGYGDYKLPKSDVSSQQFTGDSMGMIGYEIRAYSVDNDNPDIIYISEEDDARDSIRWKIKINSDSTIRIQNMDLYYATNKYLYFGSRLLAMSTDSRTALDNLRIDNPASGNFRFFYQGAANYYMWCNDGLDESLNTLYTNFYSNHGKSGYIPNYNFLEEQAGTFHMDAGFAKGDVSESGNLTQADLGGDCQIMHIYKRVYDPYTSTYETNVYTDLKATLSSDGTYTIDLETYATGERQFQKVEERPTDFIFVLDNSASMYTNQDAAGYELNVGDMSLETAAGTTAGKDTGGGTYTGSIKIRHEADGSYCPVSVIVNSRGNEGSWISPKYYKDVWVYYTHADGTIYWLQNGSWVASASQPSSYTVRAYGNSDSARNSYTVYTGPHYVSYESGGNRRIDSMRNAVMGLTYKIANEAASSGLDHRMALVTFGSNGDESWLYTGLYNNSGSFVQYSGESTIADSVYANALVSEENFSVVRSALEAIPTHQNYTGDADTYSNYGFDMANEIIANSDSTYTGEGDRSVCIIMITDGVPGVGSTDYTSANTTAEAAIDEAYIAKCQNGAYVYSVQIGSNSMDGFNMDAYMDYVSSEFVYATDMSNPGSRNVKDVEYRIDVPTGSDFDLTNLVDDVFNSVTSNSTNAVAHLDAKSILREHITDAFVIPDNVAISVKLAQATRDGIGRLSFETPVTASGVTATQSDSNNNVIEITGYDYSSEYISSSHNGRKLVITISGVIANADSDLVNTSINNTSTTAIYQDSTHMNNGIAVKYFPTENFTIPEYTYILDYALPMLDTDVNGTMLSIDSTPAKQTTYKTSLDTETVGLDFVNNNQDLVYSLNSCKTFTVDNVRGYVLIDREDGTYDWFRINVLPASNVLFEEDSMDISTDTSGKTKWASAGTSKNLYQSLSGDNDVYGYETAYLNNVGEYSNGTYLTSTVSSTNNTSNKATFEFAGTGFNLISACGTNTGIQVVTVKQGTTVKKVFVVDTYYNDTTYGTLTQVPIINYSGDYATYTVESTAAYLSFAGALSHETVETSAIDGTEIEAQSAEADAVTADEIFAQLGMEELAGADVELIWMDENSVLNGGTGAAGSSLSTQADGDSSEIELVNCIDGIRIFNPLTNDAAYVATETNAEYYNVIDEISAGNLGGNSLVAYIESGTTGSDISFGDYSSNGGPDGEVYLAPGSSDAIAFKFKVDLSYSNPPKAMIGLRAVSGNPTVKIGVDTATYSFALTSSTEMYYDITNQLGIDSDGYFTITIQNSGSSGLLSVGNIKIVNADLVTASSVDLLQVASLMSMEATPVEVETLQTSAPESKYPDYVPDAKVENPDPGLDSEGTLPSPSVSDETDDYSVFKLVMNKIAEIFKKVIAIITKLFTIY